MARPKLHEMESEPSQMSESHESKDSQAFLDALKAELGWGARHSGECINGGGGVGDCACTNHNEHDGHSGGHTIPRACSKVVGGPASFVTSSARQLGSSASLLRAAACDPDAYVMSEPEPEACPRYAHDRYTRVIEASDDIRFKQGSPPHPTAPSSHRKTMETSQLSPTQVNTDRDYRLLCVTTESSALDCASLSAGEGDELRNLVEDGTDAVDFGDLEVRPSSQISEDAGFDNTRSLWRTYRASQLASNGDYTPHKADDFLLPETPASPRNPFATNQSTSNIPFAGTQLFRETQLLTSAAKQTPSSSRPSPRLLYDMTSPNAELSPAKDDMKVSSPATVPPPRQGQAQHRASRMRSSFRPSPDDVVLESPSIKSTQPRNARQPMAHYEPMKYSQQRKAMNESPAAASVSLDSDFDDDAFLVLERRKRLVEKKKAQAARELDRVSLVRAGGHRDSDSSPGGKRRKLNGTPTRGVQRSNEAVVAVQGEKQTRKGHETTQEHPRDGPPPLGNGRPLGAAQKEGGGSHENNLRANKVTQAVVEEDRIPATSPAQPSSKSSRRDALLISEAELCPEQGISDQLPQFDDDIPPTSSDVPLNRGRTRKDYGTEARKQPKFRDTISSEASEGRSPSSSATSPSRYAAERAVAISSANSALTPLPSSASTPVTSASAGSDSSGAGQQSRRSRTLRSSAAAGTPQPCGTDSTDELQRSPASTSGLVGRTASKPGRAISKSLRQTGSGVDDHVPQSGGLFEGMVFAISMQTEQNGSQRTVLEKRIVQAGGVILEDGFQGLFETPGAIHTRGQTIDEGDAMKFAHSSADCGFTALIADGHSRKPKYMQALALGLPCLAHQWISACLASSQLLDWQPYLLAAGVSAALGDAIRSRCLPPYPAASARLADSVEQRPRLLAGQTLLLVAANPKGGRSWNQEYIFLAQALGPRVHRVSTAKEFFEALRVREEAGSVFDWVYIDEAVGFTADLLLPVGERAAAGKKRKKMPVEIPRRVQGVRVLSNELVIQSLISGRMVGEDEMPS